MRKETIKQGGCYQRKDRMGWIVVGVKREGYYQVRDIEIDDELYDEEIRDMSEDQIREIVDTSICYTPSYHKKYGLYAVTDESYPTSEGKIFLQDIKNR